MLRSSGFLARTRALPARPPLAHARSHSPASPAGSQGSCEGSSPPSSELQLLLAARRLSRARLVAAVQRERQQAAQERAALQRQLDRARGELEQAHREMAALRAALEEAEEVAGRAHQERAALLKELKLQRAERAGAAEHVALAERRCQVGGCWAKGEAVLSTCGAEPAGIPQSLCRGAWPGAAITAAAFIGQVNIAVKSYHRNLFLSAAILQELLAAQQTLARGGCNTMAG